MVESSYACAVCSIENTCVLTIKAVNVNIVRDKISKIEFKKLFLLCAAMILHLLMLTKG